MVELAERLIANGIDVILDVWDLKPGHDKYAFMEQSVNDPSVNKVLIICDKTYTAKADARQGGVGDETVIISPEIYGRMNQEKFIPIAFEADESGKAYIPHYLKSRIYFDLSTEDDRYEVEYEKLLRNIYDMPQFKKPALGKKPEWLEPDAVNLSPIRDVIKQIRGYTGGQPTKADYLLRHAADLFVETAKEFVLPDDKPEDEGLLMAIDQTKGYRDAFLDFCESMTTVSRIAPVAQIKKLKRVAAYARVSTGKDAMLHSLAAQVSYYSDLIQRNPEYEYAGVYAEMCPPTMIQMHPPCTPDAP